LRSILRAYPRLEVSHVELRCGVATTRWATQPQLAGLKLLARTEQVLAAGEAAADGWDDMLMLDSDDHVISSSRANVFVLLGEKVATPCLDRCGIAGTRRELLLNKILPAMACDVEIRPISLPECLSADALVTTNSVSGVTRVRQLGESPLTSAAGSEWVMALQRVMAEASA
jgi:4-amino-4-deoxychorismate lyase